MTSQDHVLRYGVIGVGMMGCEHIRNLQAIKGCAVVAFADTHEPSRNNAKHLVAEATSYVDYREMLSDEQLDVVVIATPNQTHSAIFEYVIKFDLHVFDSALQLQLHLIVHLKAFLGSRHNL